MPIKSRFKKDLEFASQINVTPFVDVMLVLLVVFMITAPLLTVGVSVDLPQSNAPSLSNSDEPVVITLNKDGVIFFQESIIERERLVSFLQTLFEENSDLRIFIRADRSLNYEKVLNVMGDIVSAGFEKIALVSEIKK